MVLELLKKRQLLTTDDATLTPLTGGVSCEIYLVEDGDRRFVVKRALSKLKVKQDWFANTNRNRYEQQYLSYVGALFPQWVPKVLAAFPKDEFFTMEFLPGEYRDWKKRLLAGERKVETAATIGKALGAIHRVSWHDLNAMRQFDSDENFEDLRLSPYFVSLVPLYPQLRPQIEQMCQRIRSNKHCLVHGDFSPKNILVAEQDIKIVDCEVAWFGDPCFDIAFALHHLLLKRCHLGDSSLTDMAVAFYDSYRQELGESPLTAIDEQHLMEVTLFMMLARLDGKSPVEYLSDTEKTEIRERVMIALANVPNSLDALIQGVSGYEYSTS